MTRNAPRPVSRRVFDALCLGDLGFDKERIRTFQDGVVDLDALTEADLLKSDHFLHLRCEVPASDMLELFDTGRGSSAGAHDQPDGPQPRRRPVRQPRFLSRRCAAAAGWTTPPSNAASLELQAQRAKLRDPNRRRCWNACAARNIALASHDDRTEEEIAENAADGIRISEFPVTMAAATRGQGRRTCR